MDRRSYIAGTATAALALSTSGCLGVLSGSPGATEDVVLGAPDRYEDLREARDAGALPHPIHADQVPEATVPAPLHDRAVSTAEFVGDRHALYTFIFTRCPSACQLLTQALRHVQSASLDEGFVDDVALLPVTFDPAHDTQSVLREHGSQHGVVWDAGNWYYLRPESRERAETVANEQFGVGSERLDDEDRKELGFGEEMKFNHSSVIFLVNKDGYVERAFTGAGEGSQASPVNVLDAVTTLRERW